MKKYLFLLLIGASYLKSSAGDYSPPLASNDGSPIKKETIISFVFGRKINQPVSIYVNRETYKNFLENQLSLKKLNYPSHYNSSMTLEDLLNKLEWVKGSKFNESFYKNTGVHKKTGAIEILTSLYPDWGSLPSTLENGTSIGYWSLVDGNFVDPWIKDNCGNIILSNIPQFKPSLDDKVEQPQKEYANLPCRMGRIEMGKYDIENGVTYGRFSADGRYHYLNRNGSWSELINGEWVEIICEIKPVTKVAKPILVTGCDNVIYVKDGNNVDGYEMFNFGTIALKNGVWYRKRSDGQFEELCEVKIAQKNNHVETTQTVYGCNCGQQNVCQYHQQNYCNNGYPNQIFTYTRSNNFSLGLRYEPDRPQERIIYRDRPQPRQRRQEMTNWGNSYPMDSGNQKPQQNTNWGNSYSMDSGNQRNNYNNNNYTNNNDNNRPFDMSGRINGVGERVGQ